MTGPLTSEFSADVVERVILPEPQAANIPVTDEELPGGARSVVKAARAAGFTVRATYARGPWQESGSESYTIKQCIAVLGLRSDVPYNAQFIATWISPNYPRAQEWKFNTAHIAGAPHLVASTVLKDFIDPQGALDRAAKKRAKEAPNQ